MSISFEEGEELLFSNGDLFSKSEIQIIFPKQEKLNSITNLVPGVYLINEEIPLIIRSSEPKEVMVVYPYVNNIFYSKDEKGSLLINEIDQTYTLDRPSEFNEMDQNMISLLYGISDKVGVVSDFDLNEKSNWYHSSTLLIYGKAKFYSQDIIDNLWSYYEDGGNIIFITSDLARYNFDFNRSSGKFSKSSLDGTEWQHAVRRFPFTPESGGVPLSAKLKLNDEKELLVISDVWMGFNNDSNYSYRSIGSIEVEAKSSSNIVDIGYVFKDSTTGRIYNLGTEAWLYKNNFSRTENKSYLEKLILDLIQ
ncbi:MAG: hypothetical protein H6599_10425 [Flavobacteriales bacterium]|nr:hypothetical protein [Flavobacteriales bacterium]